MKKLIFLSISSLLLSTSCMTLNKGRRQIVLVDIPENTTVSYKGKPLEVEDVTALKYETTIGKTTHVTVYKYPGVQVKLKKNTVLDLKCGDKEGSVTIIGKPAVTGLIVEGLLTMGLFTIIDLATDSYRITKDKYVDAPAILNHKTPREKKELIEKLKADFKINH